MEECLGPQCATMVLEWLKARAAGSAGDGTSAVGEAVAHGRACSGGRSLPGGGAGDHHASRAGRRHRTPALCRATGGTRTS